MEETKLLSIRKFFRILPFSILPVFNFQLGEFIWIKFERLLFFSLAIPLDLNLIGKRADNKTVEMPCNSFLFCDAKVMRLINFYDNQRGIVEFTFLYREEMQKESPELEKVIDKVMSHHLKRARQIELSERTILFLEYVRKAKETARKQNEIITFPCGF